MLGDFKMPSCFSGDDTLASSSGTRATSSDSSPKILLLDRCLGSNMRDDFFLMLSSSCFGYSLPSSSAGVTDRIAKLFSMSESSSICCCAAKIRRVDLFLVRSPCDGLLIVVTAAVSSRWEEDDDFVDVDTNEEPLCSGRVPLPSFFRLDRNGGCCCCLVLTFAS